LHASSRKFSSSFPPSSESITQNESGKQGNVYAEIDNKGKETTKQKATYYIFIYVVVHTSSELPILAF
jgi:hypothetical protein